jgi:hypothetical protein
MFFCWVESSRSQSRKLKPHLFTSAIQGSGVEHEWVAANGDHTQIRFQVAGFHDHFDVGVLDPVCVESGFFLSFQTSGGLRGIVEAGVK